MSEHNDIPAELIEEARLLGAVVQLLHPAPGQFEGHPIEIEGVDAHPHVLPVKQTLRELRELLGLMPEPNSLTAEQAIHLIDPADVYALAVITRAGIFGATTAAQRNSPLESKMLRNLADSIVHQLDDLAHGVPVYASPVDAEAARLAAQEQAADPSSPAAATDETPLTPMPAAVVLSFLLPDPRDDAADPDALANILKALDPPHLPHFTGEARIALGEHAQYIAAWLDDDDEDAVDPPARPDHLQEGN